jgi:biopolymer transport protein ExbD
MSIKAPGSRIGSSVKMKGLKVGGHRARKSLGFSLNLTPMIEMFLILVVFLLVTFSATGEILLQQPDIQLPKAYSGRTLERYPMIGISANSVVFEGDEVMKTPWVTEKNYPDLKLPELGKVLKASHDQYLRTHPMPADKEKADKWLEESKQVVIQADVKVPFEVIRLVMTTAAIEGYSSINFAILKMGKDLPKEG